ncbi:MAG TPA: sulfite exporter TauE/SafE family protein [Nitrososphaerales archaeon]|nr:sulfite exporter TauE/SafE family protein [Nitrososphaerales archaeon]
MVDVITILLLSILAGLLGSLVGLGGSLITTPALVALGVPVKYAIAAGMVTIIATSSGSASSYVREKIVNVKAAMYLEMFTIVGAIAGASVTSILPAKFLYFFFAAFLLTSFVGIGRRGREEVPQAVNQDGLARWLELEGSYHDKSLGKDVSYKLTRPALGGAGMFVAGIAAGMLGIGAGAFKVSVHELILRMPSKVSTTTSSFIIGMTALAGASVYFFSGLLYLDLAAPMMIGTTLGAFLGGRRLNRIRGSTLRRLFLVVVLLVMVEMLYKGVTA